MEKLENFTERIPAFAALSASEKIEYFSYYLIFVKGQGEVSVKEVSNCFLELHLHPYSNISQYLRTKSTGKGAKFISGKSGYSLARAVIQQIEVVIGTPTKIVPTNNLFPIEILDDTRGYIVNVANQALICYDKGLYDASLVMIRKLLETLIIEAFERYNIASKIKNKDGHFMFLSDLIGYLLAETKWNIGRNTHKALPKIKKLGDSSAHNRRYMAKKPDIDNVKAELREIIQELVHLIDYPNWKHT